MLKKEQLKSYLHPWCWDSLVVPNILVLED